MTLGLLKSFRLSFKYFIGKNIKIAIGDHRVQSEESVRSISPKEPHSKAFEAWAVCFCEAHPAITELEMLPSLYEVQFRWSETKGRTTNGDRRWQEEELLI